MALQQPGNSNSIVIQQDGSFSPKTLCSQEGNQISIQNGLSTSVTLLFPGPSIPSIVGQGNCQWIEELYRKYLKCNVNTYNTLTIQLQDPNGSTVPKFGIVNISPQAGGYAEILTQC